MAQGWLSSFLLMSTLFGINRSEVIEEEVNSARYNIEGRVFPPEGSAPGWQSAVRIHVNAGEIVGFVREDGTFVVHNVPFGSYVVEVLHPDYAYEPARVEINSKGKFRARKVNYVQTSQVIQMPYPLRMKPLGKMRYFQPREQWRLTDFLVNPMVLMMLMPLLLIMILPKMMNDPETKEYLKQGSDMTKMAEIPDMSEMMTKVFGDGSSVKAKSAKQVKKKQ